MTSNIQNSLEIIFTKFNISSEEELVKYFVDNPTSIMELMNLAADNLWISFVDHARDGWYCLNNYQSNQGWSVFFKERGVIAWKIYEYHDIEHAIVALFVNAGYCNFVQS